MPGTYQATLTVGDWSMTQSFDLVKDPRVTTSDDDLGRAVRADAEHPDASSPQTATAVNTIRTLRTQLDDWSKRLAGDDAAPTRSPRPTRVG